MSDKISDEIKTAAEIEKKLKEKRQQEEKKEKHEEEKTKSLGIIALNKNNRGRVIVIIAAVLALMVVTAYYTPTLIDRIKPEKGKKKTEYLVKRTTGRRSDLGRDTDPFPLTNPQVVKKESKTPASKVPQQPIIFSRALVQSVSSSSSSSENTVSHQVTPESKAGVEGKEGSQQVESIATAQEKRSLSKITRVPYDPNLFIPENTSVPCSLDRRFVSDLTGKMTCTVNDDIYSANGNVKLIEKGTAAYLVYKTSTMKHGQGRAFLIATKLRTRTQPFIDIPLVDSNAAGALGEAGVDGWIETHFWDRFSGAMMLGMIPDVMAGLTNTQVNKDRNVDYTANSREAFADIARTAVENSANIPPTLYKNQGEIITLIIGEDLDFSGVYRLKMQGGRYAIK